MQSLNQIISQLTNGDSEFQPSKVSIDVFMQKQCDYLNSKPGNLTEFDCPDCMNRGFNYKVIQNELFGTLEHAMSECHCNKIRRTMTRIKNSGLAEQLQQRTFEKYETPKKWQAEIKQNAEKFLADNHGNWFFCGGQNGSGKTHICTAITGELIKQGKSARYMLWRDESVKLKAAVNDDSTYFGLINPLKTADVLYIDDFFKTSRDEFGKLKPPTQGDINVAFELINYRYNNQNLITIFSSERFVTELLDIDEAVGSRIYERTKNYCNQISWDKNRNFRLKK